MTYRFTAEYRSGTKRIWSASVPVYLWFDAVEYQQCGLTCSGSFIAALTECHAWLADITKRYGRVGRVRCDHDNGAWSLPSHR